MSNKLTLAIGGVAAVLIIGLAIILIVVVSGGGDKKSDTSGEQARETPAARATSGSGSTGGGSASGELRLRGDDPLTLDPAVAQDAGSAAYIVEIFSGLVRLDKDLKIQPDLADSQEISADGLAYTFHLNKKATFHDGRPVSAEDVKYSWERALSPDTASIVAENFLGDIVGAKDVSRGRATEISGVKVIDDTTLQVTIDAPKPYFIYKLTYPTSFVVQRAQIEGNPKRWTLKPIGTGPYKLKEWRLGEKLTIEAYDKHYLGPPKLKTVSYDLQGGSGLVTYEDGDIDITGVGLDDLDRVQDPNDELHAEYHQTPRQSIDYIGFNTTAPPFDDPKVRQAFAMSVDRQKIAEVVLKGAIPVAKGLLMPGVPGYVDQDKTLPYDPVRAKQLLQESRYAGNLPPIKLAVSGAGANAGPYDDAVVQGWKQNLGVDVEITQAESATFFNDLDQRRYQMFHLAWIMDYPDPEDLLDVLFYSKSRQNNSGYSNADIDAKIESARIERDTEKRLAIYQDIEKTLINDVAWVPMFFDTTHSLVKPYVKNFELAPSVIERFRDVEVDR